MWQAAARLAPPLRQPPCDTRHFSNAVAYSTFTRDAAAALSDEAAEVPGRGSSDLLPSTASDLNVSSRMCHKHLVIEAHLLLAAGICSSAPGAGGAGARLTAAGSAAAPGAESASGCRSACSWRTSAGLNGLVSSTAPSSCGYRFGVCWQPEHLCHPSHQGSKSCQEIHSTGILMPAWILRQRAI